MKEIIGAIPETNTGRIVDYMTSGRDKETGDIVKIGDAATVLGYSHCYAATVIGVRGDKRKVITIQWDTAIRTDDNGMSEVQSYRFESNPEGRVDDVRYRKGAWRIVGSDNMVRFGSREAYHDYSF